VSLAVVEHFYSFQGEGRYVGTPSVFVRLGGCNLGCKGFGVHTPSAKDNTIMIVGCDSIKAVHNEHFAHLWEKVEDLIPLIMGHLKGLDFKPDIVFTGGEPLLHYENAVEIFVKAIESIGIIMGIMSSGHCWRVAEIATTIGQNLEISGKDFDDLYYGAALHDIGILEQQKNEYVQLEFSYNDNYDAWGNVKSHPVIGANMVENIALLSGAAPIIRHHHENYDGTGYPDGLKGDEIPLSARIVAVAEMYENALLNSQPVGAREIAKREVEKSANTILDPLLVNIFLTAL